jgi:sulfopyruvate decarboxylase TPP-binding subunit
LSRPDFAANEGDAVAIGAGAALGGEPTVVMMQNSGLGNAVSPLTSLTWVFRIPVLLIITQRGAPGLSDEPQHELMGSITGAMLDAMQIPWETFPSAPPASNRHWIGQLPGWPGSGARLPSSWERAPLPHTRCAVAASRSGSTTSRR